MIKIHNKNFYNYEIGTPLDLRMKAEVSYKEKHYVHSLFFVDLWPLKVFRARLHYLQEYIIKREGECPTLL